MTTDLRIASLGLLCIPVALWVAVLAGYPAMLGPLCFVTAIYIWIWLRFRPGVFVIHPGCLEVIWPLKRRTIPRASIVAVRILDMAELKRQLGRCARIGAGGLWGGFGWLWTSRRGIVQMYITRTDRCVWIERGRDRPWLITPDRPEAFVRALSARIGPDRQRPPLPVKT